MNRKKELIITSLVCLLPILIGILLYDKLPDSIATHFGVDGEADGWSSKNVAVFFIPGFMLVMNVFMQVVLNADPKRQNMSPALYTISIWTVPVLSVLMNTAILGYALGYSIRIEIIAPLLSGVLFIVIGNFLPKTKQNYTMGIKLPWTLASEENWNKTHRLGGFIWVVGGILTIIVTLLNFWHFAFYMAFTMLMVIIPCVYSYILYKKGI